MRTVLGILFFLVLSTSSSSQASTIEFRFTYEDEPLELEKVYHLNNGPETISFDLVKLYVSLPSRPEARLESHPNHVFLIDLAHPESLFISVDESLSKNVNAFFIGLDSLTNVAGALGGALDPLNGMYWTWQSGYINIKIEGVASESSARNNAFRFHLGGYQHPFLALQSVHLPVTHQGKLVVQIPLDLFIAQSNLDAQPLIMSPSEAAVTLSQLFASLLIFNP